MIGGAIGFSGSVPWIRSYTAGLAEREPMLDTMTILSDGKLLSSLESFSDGGVGIGLTGVSFTAGRRGGSGGGGGNGGGGGGGRRAPAGIAFAAVPTLTPTLSAFWGVLGAETLGAVGALLARESVGIQCPRSP